MEDRLHQLELGHNGIANSIHDLSLSVERLSSAVSVISSKVETHIEDEKNYEQTIRNIDDNVNALRLEMAKLPLARSVDVKKQLDPVWISIRKHDNEIEEFKLHCEKEHANCQEKLSDKITDRGNSIERR